MLLLLTLPLVLGVVAAAIVLAVDRRFVVVPWISMSSCIAETSPKHRPSSTVKRVCHHKPVRQRSSYAVLISQADLHPQPAGSAAAPIIAQY